MIAGKFIWVRGQQIKCQNTMDWTENVTPSTGKAGQGELFIFTFSFSEIVK